MSKSNKPADDDQDLFLQYMKDVKPLSRVKKVRVFPSEKKPIAPKPTSSKAFTNAASSSMHVPHIDESKFVHADTVLSHGLNQLNKNQRKQFISGNLRIEATLDLHGLMINHAHTQLNQFIANCFDNHVKNVLIIHGKGAAFSDHAILKSHLNDWLKDLNPVLAFHSAKPKDGGTGAVYVLLRSNRAQSILT